MKKIYSLILLISFALGAMQPVMPMVEYAISGEKFADIFNPVNEMVCHVYSSTQVCDICDENKDDAETLLDTDYYPIPLQAIQHLGEHILKAAQEMYEIPEERTLTHYYNTEAPPPRLG